MNYDTEWVEVFEVTPNLAEALMKYAGTNDKAIAVCVYPNGTVLQEQFKEQV